MSTLGRYFHTVRYLRPIQVVGRVRHMLVRPRADLRVPPPARRLDKPYTEPIAPKPSLVAPDRFRFLNVERGCSHGADWDPPDVARLWTYNLHYFDDLNAEHSSTRKAWHEVLLQRWVAENPPGLGPGWEPYPVSRRIVNWIKWTLAGNVLPPECHASLAIQARWLVGKLEYHILGNHLFANAKALVYAGVYFSGEESGGWYSRGMDIVARELEEQVLPDGGHFERSTMYHAAALEDLLDLINVLRACERDVPATWRSIADRMQRWLRAMIHPDGQIAFFNDAALDIAPTLADLESYSARLGLQVAQDAAEPLVVLGDSGYVHATVGPAHLICDCAPVGPDYLPGHGHADSLSFEMSLGGRRVLVNSGTSEYGTGVERLRQRGTAAHNCVVIDGQDSSEVWGGFRVARRARARLVRAACVHDVATVEASHDGYRRLPGRNEHSRRWVLDPHSLTIEDRIEGTFHTAEAWFHIPPDIEVRHSGEAEVLLRWSTHGSAQLTFAGATVRVVDDTWHPRFGVSLATRAVVALFSGATLTTRLCWESAG